MTCQEFSDQFDVLYNNITSNQAPGLDDYEKSVFLTKAQTDILLSYYYPVLNKTAAGFDGSPRRQIDFSNLLVVEKFTDFSDITNKLDFHDNTQSVDWGELAYSALVIINEHVTVTRNDNSINLAVVPITFDEYHRILSKPFKRPHKYQAWRLIGTNNICELIVSPNDEITAYTIRYVKKPNPIILSDLSDEGLTIEGESAQATCELDPTVHNEILQRAVELAKSVYMGDLQSQLVLGGASQTMIGAPYNGNNQQQ